MKKKILALFTAAALMAAGVPAGVMAEGDGSKAVKVTFSAGTPQAVEVAMEDMIVKSDVAESVFPVIKDNEPAGVSFTDVLVQAHIKKYGKEKVKDNLDISIGDYGTQVNKQFGREGMPVLYVNDKSLQIGVSEEVKNEDILFSMSYSDNTHNDLYGYLDKKTYKVKAGNEIKTKVSVDNWGKAVIPDSAEIKLVRKSDGKLSPVKAKYNNGELSFIADIPGEKYIYVTGKVTYDGWAGKTTGGFAGAIAKVTVGLDKAKITKAKAKGKKAVLKWKKVTGAKKYEVYKGTKKKGKFKKIATVKKTTYTDKKVKKSKKNKNYFYKVRAIAKADGKIVKGKFSKTVRIKIKKAR